MNRRRFIRCTTYVGALAGLRALPALAATELPIRILRTSENGSSQTGELFVDGKMVAHTLELPWKNNQSYVSSIPTGTYRAIVRYDKTDQWRFQLESVPNRTGVQIHVGNYPTQIEGCVLVGRRVNNSGNAVSESSAAYAALKRAFYGAENPTSSPDVVVKITVAYGAGRTEFSGPNLSATYQDSGRWKVTADGRTANFTESYRDLTHIYMSGSVDNQTQHLRLPLFGGKAAVSDSANGPWEEEDKSVARKN
ncbi:MAG: hypothetical protein KAX36_07455 [Thermoflexales bacterium]|nr:hypothetical protein [Thermoflexales bacterium]